MLTGIKKVSEVTINLTTSVIELVRCHDHLKERSFNAGLQLVT